MKTLYFTATGNSLHVAKTIGGELLSIPKLMAEGKFNFEDEAIGIVSPCYGLSLPRIVKEFLAKAELKADYSFAVLTYGNMAASGLKQMERAAKKAGLALDYTNEILMVDNFLPLFNIKDQLAKESNKGIEAKLKTIAYDVAQRKRGLIKRNPITNLLGGLVRPLFSSAWLDGADKKFRVTDACNGCGICVRVCPIKNIRLESKPQYLHKCEGCFSCIHNCPKAAIHLTTEKSGARFRNRNVTLGEIITANEQ